jgi:predicted nuclease of predicted toxin-antitoxin system
LRDATDRLIFFTARNENAVVMTKDGDFVKLLEQNGSPPKVIWLTCGNTSNARLKQIFFVTLNKAMELLELGEDLVEINSD